MTEGALREVDLHLTNRCNLTCAHCSVDSGPGRSAYAEMRLADWMRVVGEAAALGCRYCDLTGGEPVLFPGVEQLIPHVLAAGMHLELQSNGILLTSRRLESLREAGLRTLVISLDGDPARHDLIRGWRGGHERAIEAIGAAAAMGFAVRVTRVAVTEADLTPVGDFVRRLEALGARHLSLNLFSPVTPAHFGAWRPIDPARWLDYCDELERVSAEVSLSITYEVAHARPAEIADFRGEETRCLIERKRWFLIRSDGEVFPCYHFVHSPEMSVGNVLRTPLAELVNAANPRWDAYAGIGEIPAACQTCGHARSCGGGCPSPGYLNLSSLKIKDVRCEVEREFLPVCPFVKRTAGQRQMTNIAPYYSGQTAGRPV
jgi:radical SAM protein with 4Fe4S-binding SPASM domain